MAYRESNFHVTPKGQTRDPNTLRPQYLGNSWRCYLATIANYYIVWCEAVRSAILATAWLLVLPRDAVYSADYCKLSVRLSVALLHCVKTTTNIV